MAIARITGSHAEVSGSEITSDGAPAKADIAWFNATLHRPAEKPASADQVAIPASQASLSLQRFSDRASRDLDRASRSINPQDAMKANRSLSSFYLESLLSAKIVSKAAQSVEKLTSLQ
ncbi:type III secretion system inner rod subunit SctI [Pseudomonas cucumis]|uniref:type III secretion system inner rod subunit SctI n=1 Tax=Pseudomonas cucumis TaxID=2954082 RepID=UPI0027373620|nr:type III secretion system inner rod subunit SctI [Pseudomonas cucumis]WLG88024.1 type III secretion system inner rod subunit SctI [Pseudomonas cucumis]